MDDYLCLMSKTLWDKESKFWYLRCLLLRVGVKMYIKFLFWLRVICIVKETEFLCHNRMVCKNDGCGL